MPVWMIRIFGLTCQVNAVTGKAARHNVNNGFQCIRKDSYGMGQEVRRKFRYCQDKANNERHQYDAQFFF